MSRYTLVSNMMSRCTLVSNIMSRYTLVSNIMSRYTLVCRFNGCGYLSTFNAKINFKNLRFF